MRPIHLLVVGTAVVAVVLAMQLRRVTDRMLQDQDRLRSPEVGFPLPPVSVADLAGVEFPLTDPAPDSARLLFISNTICAYCKATLPMLPEIERQLSERQMPVDLVVVSVDSLRVTGEWVESHGIGSRVALLPGRWLYGMRLTSVPTWIVVGKGGEILHVEKGAIDSRNLADAMIERLQDAVKGTTGLEATPPASNDQSIEVGINSRR